MAEYDVRANKTEVIDRIVFSDDDYIKNDNKFEITIFDGVGGSCQIYTKDIDNLILALQKAKELWE